MKRVVGIDKGNHSIKLVELEDKKGVLELTNYAINPITDGDVKATLENILLLKKLPVKRINVSLSGTSVVVRYIEMPPMKKEELKSAIKFEAEKYIPFNINEAIVDCAMLDKANSGSQRVLLVAARKKEVESLLALFKGVGLEVNTIDIDSFAFLNSFQRQKGKAKEEDVYSLVNMGARFSNMNIIIKDNVHFTRDILWGGADITNRIKDALAISFAEAEALKLKPSDKKEEIARLIEPVFERLSSQIRMSLDYFESQFGRGVESLYISGGSSYLFNIVDFLKENLGIDVMMWNPIEGIRVPDSMKEIEAMSALFAVAVGLALRK